MSIKTSVDNKLFASVLPFVFVLGRFSKNHPSGRDIFAVERIHPILFSYWSAHGSDVYLPRTAPKAGKKPLWRLWWRRSLKMSELRVLVVMNDS